LFGARTGADGIGGVSVLASETFDADGPSRRPAVQVGDPFAEKVLIECCLELFAAHVLLVFKTLVVRVFLVQQVSLHQMVARA
jgi:phosphoribosylformylglycinamidine (FGAM) synthase-like enzyme